MERLEACEHCRGINCMENYGPNNQRIFQVSGMVRTYTDGTKLYVKRCCLIACCVGAYKVSQHGVNENFSSRIKTKAAKYVINDSSAFLVWELPGANREIIKDLFTSFTPEKIELNRCINPYPVNTPYQFVTNRTYEKKLNEASSMDIVLSGPAGGTPSDIEYVYLLRDRTAVVANQSIYKIGRTSQRNFDRFKGYPKGYEILLHVACGNSTIAESKIINTFSNKYKRVDGYGSEYFAGDYQSMMKDIFSIVYAN